jgi:WD40 repeat protein
MQEIDIEKNIESLNELKLEDLMPKSILYPKQDLENLGLNNEDLFISSENFSNGEKLSLKKFGIGSVGNQNAENSKNQRNLSTNGLNHNLHVSKYEIKRSTTESVRFSDSSTVIYDIFIKEEMIIVCGGPLVKIYKKSNLTMAEMTFLSEGEDFYSLSYSEITQDSGEVKKILAVGGMKSIIKILDLNERKELHELIGHRNEIFDVKFCPIPEKSFLLLSASQDFSVRLWHAINQLQICIFGGPTGAHLAEVNSVDWHLSGDYFVSAGNDCYVKIWYLTENLNKNIKLSEKITSRELKKEFDFKTLIKTNPIFSCNTIHENWVDCVKFNGNFLISKSVDGIIYEWMPVFQQQGGADSYFLINTYIYQTSELIWYVKFGLEALVKNLLAVGNENGELFLFKLNQGEKQEKQKAESWKEKYYDSHNYFKNKINKIK